MRSRQVSSLLCLLTALAGRLLPCTPYTMDKLLALSLWGFLIHLKRAKTDTKAGHSMSVQTKQSLCEKSSLLWLIKQLRDWEFPFDFNM